MDRNRIVVSLMVGLAGTKITQASQQQTGAPVTIRGLVCEVPIQTSTILDSEKEAAQPSTKMKIPWSPLCPAPIPNASVRYIISGGQSFETTADDKGRFTIQANRPGRFQDAELTVDSEGFLAWTEASGNWLLEELARRPDSALVFAGLARPDAYEDLGSIEPPALGQSTCSYTPVSVPEEAWKKGGATLRAVLQCSYDAFDAIDIDGGEWTKKKLEGNVVLLEFWSNWCGPCVSEIPYLRDAYERLKPQGFEIIGINRNLGTPEQQKLWLTTHGVAWPQIADAQGKQGPIADAFGVEGIPKSVLIDRQGRVVGVNLRGPRLTEKVSELLDAARQASGTDRRYERQKFGPDGEGSGGAAGVSVSIRD